MSGSVIVAGARTPIGRLLGGLKDQTALIHIVGSMIDMTILRNGLKIHATMEVSGDFSSITSMARTPSRPDR